MPPIQTTQLLQVTKLVVLTDGGTGNTTLSANHALAATTINVASSTGFVIGDPFRVGAGEEQEVYVVDTVPNGTSVTIAAPGLKRAHLSGEPVVEQVADQYGPVSDAGAKLMISREAIDQFVASQRLVWTIIQGYGRAGAEFALPGLTLFNIALGMGIPRAKVLGAGTTADWQSLINAGNDFGTVQNVNIIIEAQLNDLTPLRVELYGCAFDYTGLSLQFARGVATAIPVKVLAGGGAILDKSASPWTGTTTYVAQNSEVLDGLDDFGYFAAHGTPSNTTVASGGAAGANTVTLGSGTGYVAGDTAKFGAGATVEFHQVESVSVNTLTLRSRFLRAQAAGTAVQRQQLVQLSSITTDGVTLAFGGTVTEVRSGLRPLAVGLRNGNVQAEVSCALTSWSLASWALAAGLPIPGGNVLSFLTGLGQTSVDGFYATGLLQSGKRLWANSWGVKPDISSLEGTFSNAGDPPSIPMKFKPTSGVHIAVHP
jgi:hypothetical protein